MNKDTLRDLFTYKDGKLYWSKSLSRNVKIGSLAGSLNGAGYIHTQINGKRYANHRLIFMYHYGYFPKIIDHIDGNTINNNIENLREANQSQNLCNSKLSTRNTSGIKGVSFHKKLKKWYVKLNVDGKNKFFGYYKDIDYAKFISDAMRHKYHKEFAK